MLRLLSKCVDPTVFNSNYSKAEKPDIPDGYTKNLKKIINLMTERDPNDRPTASWLLNIPAIKLIVDQAEVSRKARENKEKEEMLNKWEEELKSKEKRLKEKYEEFKYERSKYELKIKQIESINVEFERKGSKNPTRNFMPEYNTQINKSYKGIMDQLKLNHTIDDHIDTSAMYNSKDQHIRGSLKYNNMLYNKKQFLRWKRKYKYIK